MEDLRHGVAIDHFRQVGVVTGVALPVRDGGSVHVIARELALAVDSVCAEQAKAS